MQLFRRPAFADEFAGEPIKQFGMARTRAGEAKIVWRGDQAHAEVMLPNAIHIDAGGQRIFFGGDPLRERESTSPGFWVFASLNPRWIRIERGDKAWHHRLAFGFVIALK